MDNKTWKVVMMKTVDSAVPIYYRLLNMYNYKVIDVPAYKILDEILNNNWTILNVEYKNNGISILDSDGYTSHDEIIVYDEFEDADENLFEWSLKNKEIGTNMLNMFDEEKNAFSPSNYNIYSDSKLYWKCGKHSILLDFASFRALGFKCPLCERNLSLYEWCKLTGNTELLTCYNSADNKYTADNIKYNSRTNVKLNINGKIKTLRLVDIIKEKNIGSILHIKNSINLTRV